MYARAFLPWSRPNHDGLAAKSGYLALPFSVSASLYSTPQLPLRMNGSSGDE